MGTYNSEGVGSLLAQVEEIGSKRDAIMFRLFSLELDQDLAKRYLMEGVTRRVSLVAQCIKNLFEALPPSVELIPEKDSLNSATICLHAASINTFGVLDCLAHVWAKEFDVQKDGIPLHHSQIGLGRRYRTLWQELDQQLRELVNQRKPWIEGIGDFRHALAHRIPPYIPPHMVDPENEEEYKRLQAAWYNSLDREERDRLEEEMNSISHFKAFLIHDYKASPTIAFHRQIIADFLTIEEFCYAFDSAIRRRKKGTGPD